MEDEWAKMLGGYKVPYDPRPAISRLASDTTNERAWNKLFENLHHQGDIGEASSASVPILVETVRIDWSGLRIRARLTYSYMGI